MELGMIGLGRMGANMTERLLQAGHRVVVHDLDSAAVARAAASGAFGAASMKALVDELRTPRAVWLMVPAGPPVEATLNALLSLVQRDDIIIDGGNSNYKDSVRRASALEPKGIHFVDAGTSGGVWGLREGYCLMIGGSKQAVDRLRPVFESLAPAGHRGWAHVGPVGAGHFVKMVHNGIEYGLMQAYAEGFALLHKKTEFRLDLAGIADLWRHGSVVRSWLLDLTAEALAEDARLENVRPHVADSGEGRWTVEEAIEQSLSAPVITLSLMERFRSRDEESFTDRLLAVMRNKFGGHEVKKT
ncbi:MAG: decarboxylating 6-phosphogluconate dehydrogenase [Acidobacteria bacterium]|nr:MAG: decarboxylating 6-phosphogluconate dehydrogenase [Acidobacteriota bacterium]